VLPLHISSGSLLLSRCPVWARSSYSSLIDTQLHSSMRLISGCLRSTPVSWLLILSNVAPPSLCRKAASDKVLQIIEAHLNGPVYADVFEHPPPRLASRRPIWSDMTHVDTWFRSLSSVMVSAEPFLDRSRPMPCYSSQLGPCQITDMRLASSRL